MYWKTQGNWSWTQGKHREFNLNLNVATLISFFNDLGGLFSHFGWCLSLGLLGQSSEIERNPKMNISFFDDLGGLFYSILVNVCCLDHLADYQKLNVIHKHFIFWWLCRPFSHFGRRLLLGSLCWSAEIERNPKMNISFFDDLGGLFSHFGWCLSLGSLSWSSEIECNTKMNISFFDDLGALFSHFGWCSSLRSLGRSSEIEHDPKMNI